ncbi:hypothetical protein GCM10023091_39590 [Ravibacter arvi]|uniref:ATP synthase subunit I n=1 Tax=Ravibacter arvi TaxID=2051041 RepID=A0ABP8MAZ9_9BACT
MKRANIHFSDQNHYPVLRSTLVTIVLGIVLFIVNKLGYGSGIIHGKMGYILAFYLAMSFMIDRLMSQGFRNNREKFVQFYLAISVVRFLLSLTFIGIFLYNGVPDSGLFVANFFALYLFYTCFEIWGVYRKLRAN